MQKPSLPKGTRDFSPEIMVRRNFIFSTIEKVFQLYGYLPIETPALENLSSLLGKYGEEGDKLLFKVLNSGNFLSNIKSEDLQPDNTGKLSLKICEKGLRYDLTVPFARYVVQNRNDITFPFKRYQIQPVWRADRPQKGRYREFYQCDVDIIGSTSLLNETELIQIIDEVFHKLDIRVQTKINNRKILTGIAEVIGEPEKFIDMTIALDKIEKMGTDEALNELKSKGFSQEALDKLRPFIELKGNIQEKVKALNILLKESNTGKEGIREIERLFLLLSELNLSSDVIWDVPLARGLDYYTGTIIEVIAVEVQIGSVCAGGRYDDLAGVFGMPEISGVGVSFGADRIFDVMNQMNLFPLDTVQKTQILFINFGDKEEMYILPLLSRIRNAGICAELYPDHVKLKKQMAFADQRNIPYVALIGENEMSSGIITLRNMNTGEQKNVNIEELIGEFTT